MNEKHYHYEAPAAQVLVVYFENRILDASVSAERKSYGTAQDRIIPILSSKALTLEGNTLTATWAVGEEVSVYNETKDEELSGTLVAQSAGASFTCGQYYSIGVKMKPGTVVFNEAELNSAISANSPYIVLGCNIKPANCTFFEGNKNYTLDLCGHSLYRGLSALPGSGDGSVIRVNSGCSLTINGGSDCNAIYSQNTGINTLTIGKTMRLRISETILPYSSREIMFVTSYHDIHFEPCPHDGTPCSWCMQGR